MISQATIDTIFGETIATALGVEFKLADQKSKKPTRPYVTYNPITESPESLHQNVYTSEDNGADNINVSRWEASRVTVSLQFIGDSNDDIDTLRQLASNTINWIYWNRISGVVLRVLSPQVRRMTEWINQNYEQRLLLDVRVDAAEERVESFERNKTTEMTPTVDGDVKPKITVTVV